MKRFSEYITDSPIDEQLFSIDNEMVFESTFLSRLADWIGGNSKDIVNKVKEYKKDLFNFKDNVKRAYNGYIANLKNDNKLSKEEQQETLGKVINTNPKDIPSEVSKMYKDSKVKDSPAMAYLYAFALELAKETGDKQSERILKQALDSISSDVKKEARKNVEEEVAANNDKKEETPEEEPGKASTDTVKTDNKIDDKVEKIVEKDPIETLSDRSNIDINKLQSAIYSMMTKKDGEVKWPLDNANDVILGLSAIVCGGMLIKNEEVRGKILRACGIKFDKEFITQISKNIE